MNKNGTVISSKEQNKNRNIIKIMELVCNKHSALCIHELITPVWQWMLISSHTVNMHYELDSDIKSVNLDSVDSATSLVCVYNCEMKKIINIWYISHFTVSNTLFTTTVTCTTLIFPMVCQRRESELGGGSSPSNRQWKIRHAGMQLRVDNGRFKRTLKTRAETTAY